MCGIVAAWGGDAGEPLVREMLRRIRHRGPDGEGVRCTGSAALGHVRLAILDRESGEQPMANETGDLLVAFNGEIYNHRELRRGLEARHRFRTRTDTEVLLHLFEEEEEDSLIRLDGMFALAIAGPGGLLLARDPLGIKPLYYGRAGTTFLAASELKAFPAMDELHQLPAGHLLHAGETPRPHALPFPPGPAVRPPALDEALAEIRRRLEEAVVKRLMGDVPVGVFLSGGLDSSVVAALMRPHSLSLHSFTAGMAGAPDLLAAREVATWLGTEHHELVYDGEDIERELPGVIRHLESFDAPLVRSAIPMFFLSRLAARHVKVVLTGEGADELFAGYAYLERLGGGERLKRELSEITVRLQDTNLQRADRMTMAHGIEGRVPFLDLGLVRYVSRLPLDYIQPDPKRPEKWLLREACRGLVPESVLNRKKMKFSEGAGSARLVADRLLQRGTTGDPAGDEDTDLRLRSVEETYYHRLWKRAFGPAIPLRLVGRTLDPTAAAES